LVAALAAVTAGLVAAVVLTADGDMFFAFPDAPSHTVTPRRVWDNGETGLAQLGVHWTPLFHALQLPLDWIDAIYTSGAAGIIVSFLASLVTALYLYKLVLLVTEDKVRAMCAALILAASPSFLYFGVIPMLNATVMAATTANVYYLSRWAKDGRGMSLLLSGFTLTLATLAHFDTWVLAPLELGVVLLFAHRRWRSRTRTEATTLLWLLAGGYGIALFLVMNVMIFGDPLAFLNTFKESTGGDAFEAESRSGAPPGLPHLLDYPHAAWVNAGIALAIAGAAGLIAGVVAWRKDAAKLVPLLLLYPLGHYSFQALTSGSYIYPDAAIDEWVNLRYGVTLLPAFAYFAAAGLPKRAGAIAAVAVTIIGGAVMLNADKVAGWEDARAAIVSDKAAVRAATDWLDSRAVSGHVFFPVHDQLVDRFELRTKHDLDIFIDANDTIEYESLREHPERVATASIHWLVWFDERGKEVVDRMLAAGNAQLCFDRPPIQEAPRVRIYSLSGSCE
jgi:hypothetical protein